MGQSEGAEWVDRGSGWGNRLLVFNNNFYIYLCHFGVAVIVARAAAQQQGGGAVPSRQTRAESLWICKCLAAVRGRRRRRRRCLRPFWRAKQKYLTLVP